MYKNTNGTSSLSKNTTGIKKLSVESLGISYDFNTQDIISNADVTLAQCTIDDLSINTASAATLSVTDLICADSISIPTSLPSGQHIDGTFYFDRTAEALLLYNGATGHWFSVPMTQVAGGPHNP